MVHVFKPRAFNQKKNRWNKLILNCFKESMKLKRKMERPRWLMDDPNWIIKKKYIVIEPKLDQKPEKKIHN